MMSQTYNKQHPFIASIKERYPLTKPGSKRKTQHLVLDLKGSGISYQAGDSLGVYSKHDPELVFKTLQAMKATGNEIIQSKQTNEFLSLEEYLTSKVSLAAISPKLMRVVAERQTNLEKKHALETLLQESQREACKVYLANHEIWDFLEAHEEVCFSPQELADLLMPLLPRFYSISSSQKFVGEEVHLTVAPLEYESNGQTRRGVCTHYLCSLAELHKPSVPVFIQPSHGFHLPENPEIPMIMIGPGTGIAPFRAFLQERLYHHQSKGKHWLFFGEWNQAHDFFYEEEWKEFCGLGDLRLDLAFSRDQEHKIYVQHKMWEQGKDLWRWLEEGAHLYVCGDAQRMAKDVEAMLQAIVIEFGKQEPQAAKDFLKRLRHEKRYLRDVY